MGLSKSEEFKAFVSNDTAMEHIERNRSNIGHYVTSILNACEDIEEKTNGELDEELNAIFAKSRMILRIHYFDAFVAGIYYAENIDNSTWTATAFVNDFIESCRDTKCDRLDYEVEGESSVQITSDFFNLTFLLLTYIRNQFLKDENVIGAKLKFKIEEDNGVKLTVSSESKLGKKPRNQFMYHELSFYRLADLCSHFCSKSRTAIEVSDNELKISFPVSTKEEAGSLEVYKDWNKNSSLSIFYTQLDDISTNSDPTFGGNV